MELVRYGSADIPAATTSTHELGVLASVLGRLLQAAAKVVGRPVRKKTRSAPWWTEECWVAAVEYRATRRAYPLEFNRQVQFAKKEFQKVPFNHHHSRSMAKCTKRSSIKRIPSDKPY
ncbi:hypothetical protein JDV02_003104 [Purpureocillium takamizusanense]|uniref:Uncharacterized protein n=1 Tax=Purpureocillium takamizusanense TaxID=2060973 RepID=A0A9Q8QBS8_9HYPO|nr:uncharacterized protein JDV02_003104 [Purpureocillium takamizusanense]UNI16690.1 hypothetical protein JDV02_003104 [Purpureocillium takamizusanense]